MSAQGELFKQTEKLAPSLWSRVAEKIKTPVGRSQLGSQVAEHVGNHKIKYSLLGAGAVATVAYNAGGNHREAAMNRAQQQGLQR